MDIIVSHDSGGAELISCFINYTNKKKKFLLLFVWASKKNLRKKYWKF